MLDPSQYGIKQLDPVIEPTDDALALAFADRQQGNFVYDHTRGKWYVSNRDTGLWLEDTTGLVPDGIRALAREIRESYEKKPPARLSSERTWSAVERAARNDRRLAIDFKAWNHDPYILGVPGGAVDLGSGALLPPDPFRMLNMAASVAPAPPGTPHPKWSKFLKEATQDDDAMQRFLAQRAGYWLTGDVSEESFDFLWGPGGNGKGVFLKTITAIWNDYARSAPIDMFMAKGHDGHPTELARLVNVRLVVATETEAKRRWALAKLKQLTGNDARIAARFMGQDFFEYWPQFKLAFLGNHKPRIEPVDDAIERRLNLLPFTFKPEEGDEDLKDNLVPEHPAILRWAINGWLDRKEGRVRPTVVIFATQEYLAEEDTIQTWIGERCVKNFTSKELLKALFADWKTWCETAQEEPGSARNFKKQLIRIDGITAPKRQGTGIWISGIRLKTAEDYAKEAKEGTEAAKAAQAAQAAQAASKGSEPGK